MALTYNHLYDLVRRERGHKELQDVPEGFYEEAKAFFEGLTQAAAADPLGGSGEAARVQLLNGRKLLRQLYELREQKILLLSQNRCRAASPLLDTANLSKDEHGLFEAAVELLRRFRGRLHIDEEQAPAKVAPVEKKAAPERMSVRLTKAVPQFLGPQMEQYGPFSENETVELPSHVATVLIKRGTAERAG